MTSTTTNYATMPAGRGEMQHLTQDRGDPVTETATGTTTETASVPQVEDVVVVAHLFRLATNGVIHAVDGLREETLRAYPEVAGVQMERCLEQLCELLMRTDYDGFATAYRRQSRLKRGSVVRKR